MLYKLKTRAISNNGFLQWEDTVYMYNANNDDGGDVGGAKDLARFFS